MSQKNEEKKREDYEKMIRDRASKSSGLRSTLEEAKNEGQRRLREKVELEKERKKQG